MSIPARTAELTPADYAQRSVAASAPSASRVGLVVCLQLYILRGGRRYT